MQRTSKNIVLGVLAGVLAVSTPASSHGAAKNLILLLADGAGSAHITAARWYKGTPLALDTMATGLVRTYGADSIITDSAPAATAYACGHKSSNRQVGVLADTATIPGVRQPADDCRSRPVASLLDAARLAGKATGIVATSHVQHPTPAAFSAHWPDRRGYDEIAEQQVYSDLDVVFGGGLFWLLPATEGGHREDGKDLVRVARDRGYTIVQTREELATATAGRVWGVFADLAMSNDRDRAALSPSEPTLAEMTAKAVALLSTDPEGFVLFVEGSKIDWACHAHDPVGAVTELLAFDEAVGVVLDFARGRDDTIVVVVSDHGTGGMSIGNTATDATYTKLPVEALVGPLRQARRTADGVAAALGEDRTETTIRTVMGELFGIDDLTEGEVAAIAAAKSSDIPEIIGPMMSRRSAIGWTTSGHTGEDLAFFHYGIGRAFSVLENTEVGRLCAEVVGLDLEAATEALFVDAEDACASLGCSIQIDSTDPAAPVFILEQGSARATLAASTDEMVLRVGDNEPTAVHLDGIAVYAPRTGRAYVPRQVLDLLRGLAVSATP